jgi:hypothetical protein
MPAAGRLGGHVSHMAQCVSRCTCSKIREWQVGVTLFSLGNIANFVSFGEQHQRHTCRCGGSSSCARSPLKHACLILPAGYAAQSLLAAIGCVQFVSNVIFARLVLKEQVRSAMAAASTPQ